MVQETCDLPLLQFLSIKSGHHTHSRAGVCNPRLPYSGLGFIFGRRTIHVLYDVSPSCHGTSWSAFLKRVSEKREVCYSMCFWNFESMKKNSSLLEIPGYDHADSSSLILFRIAAFPFRMDSQLLELSWLSSSMLRNWEAQDQRYGSIQSFDYSYCWVLARMTYEH